jgi:hypothetical protein
LTGRTIQYALRATASHVRTRYSGASLVNSASVSLSGNSEHSLLSGDVTVEKIGFNRLSDQSFRPDDARCRISYDG